MLLCSHNMITFEATYIKFLDINNRKDLPNVRYMLTKNSTQYAVRYAHNSILSSSYPSLSSHLFHMLLPRLCMLRIIPRLHLDRPLIRRHLNWSRTRSIRILIHRRRHLLRRRIPLYFMRSASARLVGVVLVWITWGIIWIRFRACGGGLFAAPE